MSPIKQGCIGTYVKLFLNVAQDFCTLYDKVSACMEVVENAK